MEVLKNNDEAAFDRAIAEPVGTTWNFYVRAKSDNWQDQQRIRYNVMRAIPWVYLSGMELPIRQVKHDILTYSMVLTVHNTLVKRARSCWISSRLMAISRSERVYFHLAIPPRSTEKSWQVPPSMLFMQSTIYSDLFSKNSNLLSLLFSSSRGYNMLLVVCYLRLTFLKGFQICARMQSVMLCNDMNEQWNQISTIKFRHLPAQ